MATAAVAISPSKTFKHRLHCDEVLPISPLSSPSKRSKRVSPADWEEQRTQEAFKRNQPVQSRRALSFDNFEISLSLSNRFIEQQRYSEVIQLFQKTHPSPTTPQNDIAQFSLNFARALEKQGQHLDAIAHYQFQLIHLKNISPHMIQSLEKGKQNCIQIFNSQKNV